MRCFWFALAALLLGACSAAEPDAIIIRNATIIDAVNGERAGQDVTVRDGVIVTVTPATEPFELADGEIDGSGLFVMPGLWDMHVHFLYEPELTDVMAGMFLQYGVTSVRDTGGNLQQMVDLDRQLSAAERIAPRVFFSGPLLDGGNVVYDGSSPARPQLGISVPTPERARAQVAELKAAGADLIKIYELVDEPVFHALVAAAREHELPIASHVPLSMTADTAGPHVDSMEHLRNVELACASNSEQLLAQRRTRLAEPAESGHALRSGLHRAQRTNAVRDYDSAQCQEVYVSLRNTTQVPTLRLNAMGLVPPFERDDWNEAIKGLPAAVKSVWQAQVNQAQAGALSIPPGFGEWSLATIGRMKAAGVPIAAGTDTPIGLAIPGYSLHSELEFLVQGGLTPLEAIYAATIEPTRFFRITDEGQIAPGMRADLLLLSANPLADIRNTRQIERVMLAGRWVR